MHLSENNHTDRRSLFLKIGGINIAIFADDPSLHLGLRGSTTIFSVDPCEPDVKMATFWQDNPVATTGKKLFSAGRLWQLHQAANGYQFSVTSSTFPDGPYKVASLNQDFTSGEIALHPRYYENAQTIYPLEYPLDELLILNLLSKGRGVIIHGCGLIDTSGAGYLFVGQSGAGKTTMARMWEKIEGTSILSDDRIILRKTEERLIMCGTPWHGEADLASPAEAPVTKIFFLRQFARNELIHIDKTDAVARLFACCFPPFHSSSAIDFTLAFQEAVVDAVPCSELRFTLQPDTIEFIKH